MFRRIRSHLQIAFMCVALAGSAHAFEADQVSITEAHSFNAGNHMWFAISGNSNCPLTSAYFIIQRWDDQPEPIKTQRKLMYQMALTAFASGKKVRAIGAACYLDKYLFLDQIILYE